MARCSLPSLPHIFGVNLTQKPYFLVSYFCGIKTQACTLYHALHSPAITFTKDCAGKIMFDLCQALQHLHAKHLHHWDIKSDDILLTTQHTGFHPMLIDFGKSIEVSKAIFKTKCLSAHDKDEYCKKYWHIAPEIILGQQLSLASDIFSFGVVAAGISAKIPSENCFFERQWKYLEEDPKLRCSILSLLNQLERNASLTKRECSSQMIILRSSPNQGNGNYSSHTVQELQNACELVFSILLLYSLLSFQNAVIFRKLTAKMQSSLVAGENKMCNQMVMSEIRK